MAKKSVGKIFEDEIKASFPPDFYVERYKDDTSGFYGVSNPADFRLYKYPYTFLLELKTHKGKSIPFSKLRENQITGMQKAVEHKGIYGGFIFNFRELEETYYIPIDQILFYMDYQSKEGRRKSFPIEWVPFVIKFFCCGLDIRVSQLVKMKSFKSFQLLCNLPANNS